MPIELLLAASVPIVVGFFLKIALERHVGRRLRTYWNWKYLKSHGITEGETLLRLPTPSSFEIWRLVQIDGGSALLEHKDGGVFLRRWVPVKILRQDLQIVEE